MTVQIENTTGERGGEPGEDIRVKGSEPHDEHRNDRFGNHWRVHRNAVALFHTEFGERVGLAVGATSVSNSGRNSPSFALSVSDPVMSNPVTLTGLDVVVDAVVRGVQRAVPESLGEGRLPLEALRPRRPSRQTVRLRAPPGDRIGLGVSH